MARAMAQIPAAAPTVSRSAYLWPMIMTWEEVETSLARALAVTRLLTLVRRSVSLVRPP